MLSLSRKPMTSKDRAIRLEAHKLHVIALLASARIRNRWCTHGLLRVSVRLPNISLLSAISYRPASSPSYLTLSKRLSPSLRPAFPIERSALAYSSTPCNLSSHGGLNHSSTSLIPPSAYGRVHGTRYRRSSTCYPSLPARTSSEEVLSRRRGLTRSLQWDLARRSCGR